MPRILTPTPEVVNEAAEVLRASGVVAFPTETVYGLGAATRDTAALDRVYAMKGRPADNPLIAHVLDAEGARDLAAVWSDAADALAARFWPGPLTLVVPRADDVPDQATAGRPTIAVRAPNHDVARALLAALGGPISAPSANRSGHVSATNARDVASDFPDETDLIVLDAGATQLGLESTVLDMTVSPPRILRPGTIGEPALRSVLDAVDGTRIDDQDASPGTSPRHYAPVRPCEMVDPDELAARLTTGGPSFAVLCFDASWVPSPHRPIEMPQGAGNYARRLYPALREAERMSVAGILVETPPASNAIWLAILDRLHRATAS